MILAASVHWGGFVWWGNFTRVDLIAATTHASETRPLGGTR
jgi:hypothetical protein